MAETTPSISKGIQAYFGTPTISAASPNSQSSFATPLPTLAMQLNAAAPVISQKKIVAGPAKAKMERGKGKTARKIILPPKVAVVKAPSPAKSSTMKVDLQAPAASEAIELDADADASECMEVMVVDETPTPDLDDVTVVNVDISASSHMEVVAVVEDIETSTGGAGEVSIETACAVKKTRAPRKKKPSAKAVAAAAAEAEEKAAEAAEKNIAAIIDITDDSAEVSSPVDAMPSVPSPELVAVVPPTTKSSKLLSAKPSVVLPPMVEDKISTYRQKAIALAEELEVLQSRGLGFDSDRNLNMESLLDDATNLFEASWPTSAGGDTICDSNADMASGEKSPSVATLNLGEISDPLLITLNKIVCCAVQGSSLPLSILATDVKNTLSSLFNRSIAKLNENVGGEDSKIDFIKFSEVLLSKYPGIALFKALFNFESQDAAISGLRDVINSVALREAHGFRGKDAIAFEDVDVLGIWAWEVTKKESTFSKDELNIVKEFATNRRRYGRAIKAFMDAIEQLHKAASLENPKVLQSLEKVSKAFAEVEKAKEKRLEAERKKQAEDAEKALREQAKEEKLREKEDILRKKKEAAAVEAATAAERKREVEARKEAEKAAIEAEKKAQEEKKEKQRKMMQSFFVPKLQGSAAPSTCSASDDVVIVAGPGKNKELISPSACKKRTFDEAAFEKIIRGEVIDQSEVRRSFIDSRISMREALKSKPKNKRRKIKIQVPIEVNNSDAFCVESYTELVDKYIDGKMKLFQFHDYEKTRYWGTWSKKSSIINGRTFYKKDEALRNYDVDSAEEWEDEEEVGEDIIDSDEDMDPDEPNEPNELVYDDFFRHDDDFGSDNEEDGVRATLPRKAVIGKSVAGPRFIQTSPVYHDNVGFSETISPSTAPMEVDCTSSPVMACSFDAEGSLVRCTDMDKDVTRLSSFFTVIYPTYLEAPSAVANTLGGDPIAAMVADTAAEVASTEKPKGLSVEQSRALATFVHGKKCGIEKLADSVMADFISDASKALVLRSIKDMATKERGVGGIGSIRWVVKPDILIELKMELPGVEYTPAKSKKRITPLSVISTPANALFSAEGVPSVDSVVENSTPTPAVVVDELKVEKPITKPSPKKAIQPIMNFFKPKSAGASAVSEAAMSPADNNAIVHSPPRADSSVENGGSPPLDFDAIDRLVATPSATPFAGRKQNSAEEMEVVGGVDTEDLFGEDSNDISLLNLSPSPK